MARMADNGFKKSYPDQFQDIFNVQAVLKLSGRQNSIKSSRADSHVRRYKSTRVSETDFLSLISVIKGYNNGGR
jgi:hypothetical protein